MSDLFSAVDPSLSEATLPITGQRRTEPDGTATPDPTDVIPDTPTDPASAVRIS